MDDVQGRARGENNTVFFQPWRMRVSFIGNDVAWAWERGIRRWRSVRAFLLSFNPSVEGPCLMGNGAPSSARPVSVAVWLGVLANKTSYKTTISNGGEVLL